MSCTISMKHLILSALLFAVNGTAFAAEDDAQREAIEGRADKAARKMRTAQCELVLQKARERAAAGKDEAAKRAEIVAAELAKLKVAPSMKALRESVAGATGAGNAPATIAEPVR